MSAEEKQERVFHGQERALLKTKNGKSGRPRRQQRRKRQPPLAGPKQKPKNWQPRRNSAPNAQPANIREVLATPPRAALHPVQPIYCVPTLSHGTLTYNANNGGSNAGLSLTGERGMAGRGIIAATGLPLTDVVLNGVCAPGQDPRWPDVFSLQPTSVIVQTSSIQCTTVNTSAVEGGYSYVACGVVFGDNVYPGATVTKIDDGVAVGTPGPGDTPNWTTATPMNALYSSADFVGRPCGQVTDLVFNLQGVQHTIEVNAVPFISTNWSSLTPAPAGWPTHLKTGPTDLMISWGARTWHITSGSEPVRLISTPLDSRCLDFGSLDTSRSPYSSSSNLAWSGWFWWTNALGGSDIIRQVTTATWEISPKSVASTTYLYPKSTRSFSASMMETATAAVAQLCDIGMNAWIWAHDLMHIGLGDLLEGRFPKTHGVSLGDLVGGNPVGGFGQPSAQPVAFVVDAHTWAGETRPFSEEKEDVKDSAIKPLNAEVGQAAAPTANKTRVSSQASQAGPSRSSSSMH